MVGGDTGTPQAGLVRLRGGLEQHERGDAEVVDVAAAASALNAGNRRDGHGVAQRGGTGCSPLIPAAQWHIDDATQTWLRQQGHLDRLGEHALRAADEKWRNYRAVWGPRTAAAWSADWREWITREHTPAPGRPHLRSLPGGASTGPATGRTRAEQHTTALLDALTELEAHDTPTGTE